MNGRSIVQNEKAMRLADRLLTWYDVCKRDLPWRKDKDPYKIWVSEIMLQQTRVEAVQPYFKRWMDRFPTLQSLAVAEEEEVISYWQGLGYYSRARNLLQGVREVSTLYDGCVPDTKEEIAGLSGIGDYTAGAILSIAYDQKEPAIDGNVLRVFSRLYSVMEDIASTAAKRHIRELVTREMSLHRPGDFNQALMDLGASICIPKIPRCERCPLQDLCCAKEQGVQRQVPLKQKKASPLLVRLVAGVLAQGDSFMLGRRPDKGLLAGMWEFPAVEMELEEEGLNSFRLGFLGQTGQEVIAERLLLRCKHTFSHRQWDISFYQCSTLSIKDIPANSRVCWVDKKDWEKLSFAGPHRKIADYCRSNLGESEY